MGHREGASGGVRLLLRYYYPSGNNNAPRPRDYDLFQIAFLRLVPRAEAIPSLMKHNA
jgi:hypothetical protein